MRFDTLYKAVMNARWLDVNCLLGGDLSAECLTHVECCNRSESQYFTDKKYSLLYWTVKKSMPYYLWEKYMKALGKAGVDIREFLTRRDAMYRLFGSQTILHYAAKWSSETEVFRFLSRVVDCTAVHDHFEYTSGNTALEILSESRESYNPKVSSTTAAFRDILKKVS